MYALITYFIPTVNHAVKFTLCIGPLNFFIHVSNAYMQLMFCFVRLLFERADEDILSI